MADSIPVPPDLPHGLRLRACMHLMQWVAANAQPITSNRDLGQADLIIITIFARSTRTYEGVVRYLGECGFGEQGLMLCRSLWEDMVDAHWVALNEDLAVERLQQHDLYSRFLRAEVQRKYPEMFDDQQPPKVRLTNEQHKELRKLFRGGTGSWTGATTTAQRFESILSFWPTEALRREVCFWQDWVVKMLNEIVHPSGLSLARIGAPELGETDNSLAWRFGSTSEWLTRSLMSAWFIYLQTLGLIVDRYAPETNDAYAEQVYALKRDFHQANHWEKTGRLEQAPPLDDDAPSGDVDG